ncbi:hypothetical protein D9619_002675 [Psilocybe cf. subviscida]|uniref:Peptidase M48 domain-containing protein n=1 Tax=Psilocybe cf. subviscida TaxID=2480587 RepID=A0A8H5AWP2_9AGAR|nr:hypothetical protein D9619_002675 [Psilocybe cf. subviscida]
MFLQRRLFRLPPLNCRALSSTPQRSRVYVRFGGSQYPLNQFPGSKGSSNNGGRWDPRVKSLAVVAAGAASVAYYVSHLEQVAETGRWRFINTSPEEEAKLGETMRKSIRSEFATTTLPPNHTLSVHVRRVVSRILEANNLGVLHDDTPPKRPASLFGARMDPADAADNWNPDAHFGGGGGEASKTGMAPVYGPQKVWDVIVVNDKKMINAMASPGIIVVFTGILPVCEDEQGLAAVLSHGNDVHSSEIGHVVARHTAERISSQTVAWGIILVLSTAFSIDMGLSNLLQTYLLELPNSRKQETEADIIGLRLMSKACYDPAASPKMFGRLAQLESKIASRANASWDFFHTHPSSEKRVKFLEERLHEGYTIMSQNPHCGQLQQELEAFRATARPVKFEPDGSVIVR